MRVIVILFVYVFSFQTGWCQQTRQYAFRHFTTLNGLAANGTGSVVQDRDGYIWIGTRNGLQRYDGDNFITFHHRIFDSTSIPTDFIPSMYMDSKGNLWITGSNNELGIFDTRRFVFKQTPVDGRKTTFYLPQRVEELPTGETMVMRSDGRSFKYDPQRKQFVNGDDVLHVPPQWRCNQFVWDSAEKKLWLVCDSGLAVYNTVTKHVSYRGHNEDNDQIIRTYEKLLKPSEITLTKDGCLIFQVWPKLAAAPTIHRYNKKLNKPEEFSIGSYLGYHEIYGFLQQRSGRLWIYGTAFLMEWTKDKNPFSLIAYKYTRDAQYGYCFNAYEDREGNIWMATDNGVYYFNADKQIFDSYECVRPGGDPMDLNVTAVAELKDKRILVGAWGGRILCYDQKFNPLPLPRSLQKWGDYISVWDMASNKKTGDLWIALQAGGVIVYHQETGAAIITYPDVFQQSTIRQVDEDTSGNVWFGTQDGRVVKWDLRKSGGDVTKGYELIAKNALVQKIHFDYQGFVYVGTLGEGLYKIDTRTNKIVHQWTSSGKEGERLFSDVPYDMSWYNDSTLIITAGCINILNTKTNKIRWITTDEGLPGNNAVSVQRDDYGVLWVGLTNGICRVNLEKNVISYYDRRDGISYDKMDPAGVGHLSDGRIIFFTEHDFLAFNPKDFGQQVMPPKPFITSFKLDGEFLSMDSLLKEKTIVLNYDNTSIAVGFSALSYLQQRKVHYIYQMDGVDKEWVHSDHAMEVIYNSLPPGNYTFRVRSENADGMLSEDVAAIEIIVRPPFWKTWWFLSLVGLLIILILFLIDKERVKRRETLALIRRQIRANLKDEVSSTLNNINVLSEIAKIKADRNLEQAKEFIDQISEKSRYMDEVMEDTLWSIDPANDSMKKFILRIRELTEALKTLHQVEIDLIVDNKVQSMELDMKLRYELLFFYKEAMSFIIQNMYCDQLFVNINKTKSKLYIEILSECGIDNPNFETEFEGAVAKRVNALPATLDVLCDTRSFSTVLYVNV
ncbi:MAG TPA: two-component regulator propeller domain-containing protein [Flavisolibacter sp.]